MICHCNSTPDPHYHYCQVDTYDVRATTSDIRLSRDEARAAGLPAHPCCCDEHGHDWYERRTKDGSRWIECNACGEMR